MKKIDATVRAETAYIACFTLILSVLLQAVFLIAGLWDYTVLTGNLLGAAVSVGNFFLMGLTVQKAVDKEEKDAADLMRLSLTLRTALLFLAAVLGAVLPFLHLIATILPLFFPRVAVMFRPRFSRKEDSDETEQS